MTEMLDMNQIHPNAKEPADTLASNSDIVLRIGGITSNAQAGHDVVMQAQAIQYEPTLKIPYDSIGVFKTNTNDNANPIFGFNYIHPDIANIGSGQRLVLLTGTGYVNQIVLKDPWINYDLFFNPEISEPGLLEDTSNGKRWLISINLRRNNPNDNTLNINPILKIKIPYITKGGQNGYIKFLQIPDSHPDSTFSITSTLGENRGLARKLQAGSSNTIFI